MLRMLKANIRGPRTSPEAQELTLIPYWPNLSHHPGTPFKCSGRRTKWLAAYLGEWSNTVSVSCRCILYDHDDVHAGKPEWANELNETTDVPFIVLDCCLDLRFA